MKRIAILTLLSLLATGCASTRGPELPQAVGNDIRINNTAETEALLSNLVLVGPKKDDKDVRARFMREPFALLSRQPNPDDFERLGAALVETTVTVQFPFSSTEFKPNGSQRFHIRQLIAVASRVEIRGRTSNEVSTPESIWYATERAKAAKDYLLGLGMPGTAISLNVMGAGDQIANNNTPEGRAMNQRVEIKAYFEGGDA